MAGYRRGFDDTRGTLFFDVAAILKRHRPKAFFLENVKNLLSHDNGRTFEVIHDTLTELGYVVCHEVMNTMDYANIPQNRERIFTIGFDPGQVSNYGSFRFPVKQGLTATISGFLDYTVSDRSFFYDDKTPFYDELVRNVTSYDTVYQWRRKSVRESKSHVCPTLAANMGTGGHNVPIILRKDGYRKLTPKECLNFQGLPKDFVFPNGMSLSHCYKQAGNSVTVPLIQAVAREMVSVLL